MSTFDGNIAEFPDIRVDFFRRSPNRRPPLACFLSHVHSDHLAGLESLRSPFVYCSAATRELLLRLERYPCRINYAKGILEARIQTYKHLRSLLKPIPLETPTTLELEPGNHLRVTIFSANHCPGAVMFLFEGQGKAVLYTGDLRSEPWFVNSLIRHPCLLEYACGLGTLDAIYLDTSFLADVGFQTKAEGIRELLQKVSRYPSQTIFYFQAWTYGYEDVWLALSKFLGSKIHVDEYKMRMYRSLVVAREDTTTTTGRHHPEAYLSPEAPGLVGFTCGNAEQAGCLTTDENVRLHSCEEGNYCLTVRSPASPVVHIRPVVAHLPDGQDVADTGVGGGGDDLGRVGELQDLSPEEMAGLIDAVSNLDDLSEKQKAAIRHALLNAAGAGFNLPLQAEVPAFGGGLEATLADALRAVVKKSHPRMPQPGSEPTLPRTITFPFSRHSSYPELCHLISVFRPKDVWPCTVDQKEWAQNGVTIGSLFGAYCSGSVFRHDTYMKDALGVQIAGQADCRQYLSEEADGELSAAETEEVDPHQQDSQQSAISHSAQDMRDVAFQTMLKNLGGHEWQSIELISVSDNHTAPERELGER